MAPIQNFEKNFFLYNSIAKKASYIQCKNCNLIVDKKTTEAIKSYRNRRNENNIDSCDRSILDQCDYLNIRGNTRPSVKKLR